MAGDTHTYGNENIHDLQSLWDNRPYKFPVVVTALETDYVVQDPQGLPDDQVLLCKGKSVHFARVKVLPFDREEDVKSQKGEEFVTQRNEYVGKELSIPAKYTGKLKFIPRPGTRRRFTSIAQVSVLRKGGFSLSLIGIGDLGSGEPCQTWKTIAATP